MLVTHPGRPNFVFVDLLLVMDPSIRGRTIYHLISTYILQLKNPSNIFILTIKEGELCMLNEKFDVLSKLPILQSESYIMIFMHVISYLQFSTVVYSMLWCTRGFNL